MKQTINQIPNFSNKETLLPNGKIGLEEIIYRTSDIGKYLADFLDQGISISLLDSDTKESFSRFARMSHQQLIAEYKKDSEQFNNILQKIEKAREERQKLIEEFYEFVEKIGAELLEKHFKKSVRVGFNPSDPIYRYYGDVVYGEFSFDGYNSDELEKILSWLKEEFKK